MYLRIRRVKKEDIKKGDFVVILAQQLEGTSIAMQPGQLEWWDGIQWNKVKIVAEDVDNRSPYAT